MAEAKPRDPRTTLVITALSGLVLFGIGHLYVGRFTRGVMLVVVSVALYLGMFSLPFGRAYDPAVTALVIIGVGVYFFQLYDIWTAVGRPGERPSRG